MKRRLFAIALATFALNVVWLAVPAQADVKGPACVDINGNSQQSFYTTDFNPPHEAILSIRITTVDPLCKAATYTVFVSTDSTTFTAYTYPGDTHFTTCGANCLTFTLDFGSTATSPSAAPSSVFVYLESSFGQRVFDRAPNTGAPPFALCDFNASTPDYDSAGNTVPACNPPGGEYFE